ncbi:hypothetical protein SEA_SANDALPHON_74 [Mycobacterium phage Sandalphon]|uniref:Uncharacterized protein n=2 Tax=Cheoctovirus TaxID=1623281 RepID=A0A2Z5H688_9CAUD|nr:hypothetical protein I5H65_gp076 [Mycobacterium phage Minnie]YP_009962114.1 hypothetical protein I5H86_gp074 [Mycobacterium phage Sandalphon]AXC34982.1 hypothetical protein SEA_SANDALPHON_74 [Mycobacterium phage Sandalphon]QGH79645.1 hypothetical protein SEA_MINNIE_76 [Mycobacterium phage Minnie]
MNNPELRAVLTEALSEALKRLWTDPEDAADQADWDALPGKLADVIASLPGVVVIQLPEPYFEATGDEFENGRKDYAFGDVSVFADGEIHLFGAVWETAAIEEFAAGILAAVAESKRAAAAAAVVATGEEA